MKSNIIFVSGFGGAGKTTCGNMLFSRLTSAALLEADWFFNAKPLSSVDEKIYRLKLDGCAPVIRNYHREGFENIICIGYVWSHKELRAIVSRLRPLDAKYFLFWLEAPPSDRHERVLSRPGETVDRTWLENVERQIKNPWPLEHKKVVTHKIETGNKIPDAIVGEMFEVLKRD